MRKTRPPTRVNNACDRCRRQKQRCDDFRPCSNCLHARAECTTSEQTLPVKKPRLSGQSQSLEASPSQQTRVANIAHSSSIDELPEGPDHRYQTSTPITEGLAHDTCNDGRQSSSIRPPLRHSQSVLTELRESDSAMDISKKVLGYSASPTATARETFAIPGGDHSRSTDVTTGHERLITISDMLGTEFPSREVCDALVDTYFRTVHWFSLVVYEPKFRGRYTAIIEHGRASPADRAFLLLLSMIMVMGCWYGPGLLPAQVLSAIDLSLTRNSLLKLVTSGFMDLIDDDCLEFVQLSALLGSYWLYWGRPRSSFSMLGAATKSAQAMELHRNRDNRLSAQDAEEQKRVWWTIYTWDRFATIIYGRPLGINDKDCNVSMPGSFSEDIGFLPGLGTTRVSLSPYQIQLNRIYQITSPLLKNIYGIRYSHDRSLRAQMPGMVTKIDQLMQAWQDELPPHLHLEKNDDIGPGSSSEERMHRLQALSLQLTYDNLMIVIHRPLLADQGYRRSRIQIDRRLHRANADTNEDLTRSQQTRSTNDVSFRQCLNSALRISSVQQSKRHLLALARNTHLVSFLGMNLFTSSVVLFICALSDTLSDTAQEAKRGMARNLKLLKLLSGDGSLSMQCSVVLEDLVQRIIDKEKEEMLHAIPTDDEIAAFLPTRRNSYIDTHVGVNNNGGYLDSTALMTEAPELSHIAVDDQLSGNGNDSAMNKAMASLQGVIKDIAAPRTAPSAFGQYGEQWHLPQSSYNQTQRNQQDSMGSGLPGFTFDGSKSNTEDLGQFWLWNMDPYLDDSVASWHSGDDFNE